eukprot:scaffold4553_cov142-Amphora_coffeaeformis.AAC.2
MMMNALLVLVVLLLVSSSTAFTQLPATLRSPTTAASTTRPSLRAAAVGNPLSKLPWNVERERQKTARKLKQERNELHRQLGIAEDATYEEIVAATDALIAKAGSDLKAKVKVEIAKDKILQIRLNERLSGLATGTKDARAQSRFEQQGADEDDLPQKKKQESEAQAPAWTRGLIVKPTQEHVKGQLRLWGILTAIGVALPPAQDYLGRFTWLVCVAQLTFRGMPREEQERGGMGISFNTGGGGGHRKIAFALGFGVWVVGAIISYGLMPSWARGQRWTGSVAFTLQNFIFGLACSYLQPYKG